MTSTLTVRVVLHGESRFFRVIVRAQWNDRFLEQLSCHGEIGYWIVISYFVISYCE